MSKPSHTSPQGIFGCSRRFTHAYTHACVSTHILKESNTLKLRWGTRSCQPWKIQTGENLLEKVLLSEFEARAEALVPLIFINPNFSLQILSILLLGCWWFGIISDCFLILYFTLLKVAWGTVFKEVCLEKKLASDMFSLTFSRHKGFILLKRLSNHWFVLRWNQALDFLVISKRHASKKTEGSRNMEFCSVYKRMAIHKSVSMSFKKSWVSTSVALNFCFIMELTRASICHSAFPRVKMFYKA